MTTLRAGTYRTYEYVIPVASEASLPDGTILDAKLDMENRMHVWLLEPVGDTVRMLTEASTPRRGRPPKRVETL